MNSSTAFTEREDPNKKKKKHPARAWWPGEIDNFLFSRSQPNKGSRNKDELRLVTFQRIQFARCHFARENINRRLRSIFFQRSFERKRKSLSQSKSKLNNHFGGVSLELVSETCIKKKKTDEKTCSGNLLDCSGRFYIKWHKKSRI